MKLWTLKPDFYIYSKYSFNISTAPFEKCGSAKGKQTVIKFELQ